MVRLAMNELTTYRWSFEEDIRNYLAAGYQGIGVWRQKLSDFGEESGIDLLCETGIEVSSLHWAGGFTGSDGRSLCESIEDGVDALRRAAAMRAECLVVYTGARGGHTANHARRVVVSALDELAKVAADMDVTLALEPMHPGCGQGWTFLSSIEATLEFLDQLRDDSVKMVFDSYHLAHAPGILDRLPGVVPRIGLVQFGDGRSPPRGEMDRCPLGCGVLPLRQIAACLLDEGYEGFFEIELIGQEIEEYDYTGLLKLSREAFLELAASGR
jgi:sugar phosphate isomerase/epimerase